MKTLATVACIAAVVTLAGCGNDAKTGPTIEKTGPTNQELAQQIETAYVPAKACWNSFRNAACNDVLDTAWSSMQSPYQELQRQGRTESVQELASVHQQWTSWLQLCMTSTAQYLKTGVKCLSDAPGPNDVAQAAQLVRDGK